jgi:VIT1/CCC1 family predicted Fe2+/Mn2+ transporter
LAFQIARHSEQHRAGRIGWLRAAVLGANDGLVSTASLVVGVAAAEGSARAILVAGVAGLVAGAMSMAAGEYVSVSSQADTESADLARERRELATEPEAELEELTGIYVKRGVSPALARQIAVELTAKDALAAHAHDELGFTETSAARPLQAALASAGTFAVGAIVPLVITVVAPEAAVTYWVAGGSILGLMLLGGLAAQTGGAPLMKGIVRVTFWGALAMAATAGAGLLFGATG